jgi:hypothetical protein
MGSLVYSTDAGGWVLAGSTGPAQTPTAADDLIVPAGAKGLLINNRSIMSVSERWYNSTRHETHADGC